MTGYNVEDEELPIGGVAERTGVATSTLRFYEDEGLIHSTRTEGGQRRYHRDVIRRVSYVRAAQHVGLTLDEIRTSMAGLPENRTPTARDWSRLSSSWKPLINERIALLERMRDKLDGCIGCGCLSLRSCPLRNPGDVAGESGPGPHYLVGDVAPKR